MWADIPALCVVSHTQTTVSLRLNHAVVIQRIKLQLFYIFQQILQILHFLYKALVNINIKGHSDMIDLNLK